MHGHVEKTMCYAIGEGIKDNTAGGRRNVQHRHALVALLSILTALTALPFKNHYIIINLVD